eukprot:5631702-Amphidinium_carterae.1
MCGVAIMAHSSRDNFSTNAGCCRMISAPREKKQEHFLVISFSASQLHPHVTLHHAVEGLGLRTAKSGGS